MATTIKDIAKETGLSVATISKYINGVKLKERNKEAVEAAIKKLGYSVNEYARGLKSNKSRTIGVVIPELSNLFITQIITSMEEVLRAHGYSVIICDCHTNEKLEAEAVKFLLSKMVDGIINMPVCQKGNHLKPAIEKNIPILLIDRIITKLKGVCDSVTINNEAATYNATLHLLKNNHKNIGIIIGPQYIYTSLSRLNGYKNALTEHGVSIKKSFIINSDYTLKGGYGAMQSLFKQNKDITAVLATNYEMTLGALMSANDMGISIPDDLSFVGFDNMELAKISSPKLTIVTQPLEEIGNHASKLILEKLTGSIQKSSVALELSTELHLGESVKNI